MTLGELIGEARAHLTHGEDAARGLKAVSSAREGHEQVHGTKEDEGSSLAGARERFQRYRASGHPISAAESLAAEERGVSCKTIFNARKRAQARLESIRQVPALAESKALHVTGRCAMRHWRRSGAMRIIRRHELTDKVGYCLAHIYRLERAGLFPQRVHLGRRAVGWVEEEVEAGSGSAWTRVTGGRSVTGKARLQADRAELARFVDATFRYADDGTDAVLRTFAEGSNEVLGTVRVPLNGAGLDPVIEHAGHQATKAANAARPAVFAPPVATFIGSPHPRTRPREWLGPDSRS